MFSACSSPLPGVLLPVVRRQSSFRVIRLTPASSVRGCGRVLPELLPRLSPAAVVPLRAFALKSEGSTLRPEQKGAPAVSRASSWPQPRLIKSIISAWLSLPVLRDHPGPHRRLSHHAPGQGQALCPRLPRHRAGGCTRRAHSGEIPRARCRQDDFETRTCGTFRSQRGQCYLPAVPPFLTFQGTQLKTTRARSRPHRDPAA